MCRGGGGFDQRPISRKKHKVATTSWRSSTRWGEHQALPRADQPLGPTRQFSAGGDLQQQQHHCQACRWARMFNNHRWSKHNLRHHPSTCTSTALQTLPTRQCSITNNAFKGKELTLFTFQQWQQQESLSWRLLWGFSSTFLWERSWRNAEHRANQH